jgi:hypothetical protein
MNFLVANKNKYKAYLNSIFTTYKWFKVIWWIITWIAFSSIWGSVYTPVHPFLVLFIVFIVGTPWLIITIVLLSFLFCKCSD